MMKRQGASPFDVIWFRSPKGEPTRLALDKHFRGPMELAVFRSAWNDPGALFVSLKGGWNSESHAHLDLGTFEFEALGVRWARDLGSGNYGLPGYWAAKRWTYYRIHSKSHNVPLLDDDAQDGGAKAKLAKFQGTTDKPGTQRTASRGFAIIDLTSAYADKATKVLRGVMVPPGRRSALIQDEFDLKTSHRIAWGMTTSAQIVVDGNSAVLRQNGKTCHATILAPADAAFTVESAERNPPEITNKGVRRLVVRLSRRKGRVRVAVLLAPSWPKAGKATSPSVRPLAEWK